jgi:hypothetical protein
MTSGSFIEIPVFVENSTRTITESWFIPLNMLMIMCMTLVVILAILFLFIIILDKTCHTVPMMLIANTCLTALIVGCSTLSMCVFTLENDLKQIQYQDSLCFFRAYIGYISYILFNFSFLLQSIYRYVTVVYPNRLLWRSARFQMLAICLT